MAQIYTHTYHVGEDVTHVYVGSGALQRLRLYLKGDVHFLVDSKVDALHKESLEGYYHSYPFHVVEVSEKRKTLVTVEHIVRELIHSGVTRSSTLVIIGGGVLGDLGGFIASSLLRGITLIHVPTTLLAMVDSSLGGKNGVNVGAKNTFGTIYQPLAVIADTTFLTTLPEREVKTGLSEVIKYGCVQDHKILQSLEITPTLIFRCIQAKMHVVIQDPKEHSIRAILNFGHTIGHALESVTKYATYTHGEAVAIGMCAEARIAQRMKILSEQDCKNIISSISSVGLPTTIPLGLSIDKVITSMKKDKKKQGPGIPFVFPASLGEMRIVKGKYIHMVSEQTVRSALE